MPDLANIWRHNRLLVLAIGAALLVTLVLTVGAIRHANDIRHPPPDQRIEGWMTPGYIGHSWGLPRDVVMQTLSIDANDLPRGQTLDEIAEARGVPVKELIDAFAQAIHDWREAHP